MAFEGLPRRPDPAARPRRPGRPGYKLITHEKRPQRELYDLESDIAEASNLAAEKPDLVKRLDVEWQKWNAPMPPPAWKDPPPGGRDNPEYQPPLWPEENAAAVKTPADK